MKNRKGYTLIELLAVIVILAIIALVAVPIILNIINNSKKGAAIDSVYGYVNALEMNNTLSDAYLDTYTKIPSGKDIDISTINVKIKGTKPVSGKITIEKNKVIEATLCINGYNTYYDGKKAEIVSTCNENEEIIKKADSYIQNFNEKIELEDGEYDLSELPELEIKPTSGTFQIQNNKLVSSTMCFDGKKVEYDGISSSIKGTCEVEEEPIISSNNSILSYVKNQNIENDTIETITIEDETYTAHVYNYDGNQTWVENMTFGAESDVANATENAKNMIIVKVNGDLTINEGVTVTTYASENGYGGPKGLLLYVTGTLTNNGTISMTARGAKAEGQNIYLWKNDDGTYEYVPSIGASGGTTVTASASSTKKGDAGDSGNDRTTGGGGGGAARTYNKKGIGGAGGTGTSYSGGAGGGGGAGTSASARTGGNGSSIGGAGGAGKWMGGGAGNPGGSGSGKGKNGTGGLLIIYSNVFNNNGTISSNGSKGGTATDEELTGGGGSGGGSINIFSNEYVNVGSITATGGAGGTASEGKAGGSGGAGTYTLGYITESGGYVDWVQADDAE